MDLVLNHKIQWLPLKNTHCSVTPSNSQYVLGVNHSPTLRLSLAASVANSRAFS